MKKASRLVLLFIGTACLCLSSAPSAFAAVVTLGSPLSTTTFGEGGCSRPLGCTIAQVALPAGQQFISPVDGAVISWSVKGASATPGFAIRVLDRAGSSFTGVATSAPRTPAGGGLETFATALPIKKGQYLGINVPNGSSLGVATPPGATFVAFNTLADNASEAASPEFQAEYAFSAQVQPAPTIVALGATSGSTAGGTQVTITGTDLEGAGAVKFGASPATAFAVNSESQITAFSPPGTGAVPVSVTTVAGTTVAPQAFTYTSPSTNPGSPPPGSSKPMCTVPKLKGKTLKSAKKRLRAADCRLGTLTKKEGATAKEGEVVKQVPKPGATVPVDTKVKLTLAP